MFRKTAARCAVLVHLCVEPAFRGGDLASELLDSMRIRCADCYEIRLRCRRDFAASNIWPKLGFVPVHDERGRGREGTLTVWRYELAPLPVLQAITESRSASTATQAVVDANVFFDLDDDVQDRMESKGLLADWVGEFLDLWVTDELFNEINRNDDPQRRERQRTRASTFPRASRDVERENELLVRILELFPCTQRPSEQSDARQIAMTLAGGIRFFITRDERVLDAADMFEEEFGLHALAPHEIIRRVDELRREDAYRPLRLFCGPGIRLVLARGDHLEQLTDLLHDGQPSREPRKRTQARLRDMLAQPHQYEAVCVLEGDRLVVAYILDRGAAHTLRVPYFACADTVVGRTAARHYGEELAATAAREKRKLVQVDGPGERVAEALAELGYSLDGASSLRLTLPGTMTAEQAAVALEDLGIACPAASEMATRLARALRRSQPTEHYVAHAAELENMLWPLKLRGAKMPCFIVPIQARWAKELFDQHLASSTLFGADPRLILSAENVYYRASRPGTLRAPSRILWYVSDDPEFVQSKALRACSRIDDVVVALPKDLFRRFRRLGIYQWADVFALAKNDLSRELMAFVFRRTEILGRSIPWDELQAILLLHTGKSSQIQSPLAISEECFMDLYERGMGTHAS